LYPDLDPKSFFQAGQSKIANEWLTYKETCIGHLLEREYRVPGKRWRVDGFDHETNTVYEFLGDYYHGNPRKYKSDEINPTTRMTYGDMYKFTTDRLDSIRELGFKVVYIWECDFKNCPQ